MQKLLLVTILLMSATAIQAGQNYGVIVPEKYKDIDAESYILRDSPSSSHYQLLYDAALFRNLPAGGGYLRIIYFRTDQLVGLNASGSLVGAQIIASTTQRDSKSLSAVFAENIGADATVYLDPNEAREYTSNWQGNEKVSGFFSLGASGDGFFYDPAKGNLLLDFKNISFPFGLDAYQADTPIVVSAIEGDRLGLKGELTSLTPVTALNFYVVPEPSTGALLIGGMGALYAARRRSTANQERQV